jgi:hypothetical protein
MRVLYLKYILHCLLLNVCLSYDVMSKGIKVLPLPCFKDVIKGVIVSGTFRAFHAQSALLALSVRSQNINLLKPTGHVMHQQFNIQQLYVLPTLYLCVLYLSENKQRLVPLTT